MIEINPKESTTLHFKVNVSGSNASPKPRLNIPIGNKGVSLVFEGTMVDGEVEVNISELLKLTDSKKVQGILEVVVSDNIFYPWKDTIVIKEATSVKAITTKSPLKESKVEVSFVEQTEQTIQTKPEVEVKPTIKKKLGDLFSDKLSS